MVPQHANRAARRAPAAVRSTVRARRGPHRRRREPGRRRRCRPFRARGIEPDRPTNRRHRAPSHRDRSREEGRADVSTPAPPSYGSLSPCGPKRAPPQSRGAGAPTSHPGLSMGFCVASELEESAGGTRSENACFQGPSPSARTKRPTSVATTSALVTYMERRQQTAGQGGLAELLHEKSAIRHREASAGTDTVGRHERVAPGHGIVQGTSTVDPMVSREPSEACASAADASGSSRGGRTTTVPSATLPKNAAALASSSARRAV